MFEVKIDPQTVTKAVVDVVEKGLREGVSSWDVQDAIRRSTEQAVLAAEIPRVLHETLNAAIAEQAPAIVTEVVAEVLPALKTAFAHSLKASLVAMVYGAMRGQPLYMGDDERRQWNAVKDQLFPEPSAREAQDAHESVAASDAQF